MRSDVFELHASLEIEHWWFRARREILAELVSALVPAGEGGLVDVGCGTGANVAFFSRAYRCVGVDPAEEAIGAARKSYPQLEFVHGEAPRDLPDHARRAKVFLLTDVLEHVDDDGRLLEDLVRVAEPGAAFFVTVPANPRLWTSHDVAHGHHRRYDRDGLARLMGSLPVRLHLMSHFNARLYPALWLVRRLEQVVGRSVGHGGTDLRLPPRPVNRVLYRIFRGEATRLAGALRGARRGYGHGLSLVAVFTKLNESSA